MRSSLVLVVSCVVALFTSTASAQGPADLRRDGDAAVDRNIILPSAETIRAGELTFNSYELFFAGLTYGITDDLQISGTTLLPITSDFPFAGVVSLKYRFLAQDQFILSVQPHVAFGSDNDITVGFFGADLVGDYILGDKGQYVLGFNVAANVPFGSFDGDFETANAVLFGFGGRFAAQVGSLVKLLAEATVFGGYANGNFELAEEVVLFNYGVRFFGESLAVDLTFLKPLGVEGDGLLMGVPFVAFSARF